MRLRADAPIVWRAPGQSQIGVEPGRALVLEGLDAPEQRFLDHLPRRTTDIEVRRAARRAGLSFTRARALLRRLRHEGVVALDAGRALTPDEAYWERLVHSTARRSKRLRGRVVALVGPVGPVWTIAEHLSRAGVGTVLAPDPDVRAWIEEAFPKTRTLAPTGTRPDLVVTVEPHVVDPVRARTLAQEAVDQLPVVLREVTVRVGPLFGPQALVCATCLDLWETDQDPMWPAVATQARLMHAPPLEGLLLSQAMALAARAATDVLAHRRQVWDGRSVEIEASEPLGTLRLWEPHPRCVCSQARQD